MRAQEFIIEYTSGQVTNSRGKSIGNYANFKNWFRNSVAVDSSGRPLVVYHGTSASFDEFNLGSDDRTREIYGPGFYVTHSSEIANNFVGNERQNIMPLYISIQRPIVVNKFGLGGDKLGSSIIRDLIKASPNFEKEITKWGKPNDNPNNLLSSAVERFTDRTESPLEQIIGVSKLFYQGVNKHQYLALVTQLTGYDGVVAKLDSNTIYFVAWQKNQLKSATGNSGQYSLGSGNILGEKL
jgi:hypothetical protein